MEMLGAYGAKLIVAYNKDFDVNYAQYYTYIFILQAMPAKPIKPEWFADGRGGVAP